MNIVLPRGVYSIREGTKSLVPQPASQINGTKTVNEFIQSKFLEGKSNSALASIDNSNSTFESNSALASIDSPNEPKYYKYYLIVYKLLTKGIDIDKILVQNNSLSY